MSTTPAARYPESDIPQPIAVQLNSRWRIVDDGQMQWVLQVWKGDAWRPRRHHVERKMLLCSIRPVPSH